MPELDLKPKQDELTEDEMTIFNILVKVKEQILTPLQALMEMVVLVEEK